MSKGVWVWVGLSVVVVLFLTLCVMHPYLLGLSGRIHENRFDSDLRLGLTRIDVVQLAQKTDGEVLCSASHPCDGKLYNHRGYSSWETNQDEAIKYALKDRSGTLKVQYADQLTLCFVAGNVYDLSFDESGHLRSWRVDQWTDGC